MHERTTTSGLIVREMDTPPMHGRDRNQPCPCGSGVKWKRCHGRAQPTGGLTAEQAALRKIAARVAA